ncbi:MAG: alpha/beta hydrolase fold domain-containing protein [Pseudonocardia sp.]
MPYEPSPGADIRLRPPAPRARLHRPPAGTPGHRGPRQGGPAPIPRGLVVLLVAREDTALAAALSHALAAAVLAVPAAHVAEAYAALAWAADHAAELGADPARVAVVGLGDGVCATRVAELAAREGWPPLRAVVTVGPGEDAVAVVAAAFAGGVTR